MRASLYFITSFLLLLVHFQAQSALAIKPGEGAPDFSLPSRDGSLVELRSYKGKVVYIDFWASWCSPCKRSLPWMENLKREFKSDQFEILAVNLDTQREDAERMLAQSASNLTVLFDPTGAVPEKYGVATMPTSYLVNRSGEISAVFEGFDNDHQIQIENEIRAQFK